MKSIINIGIDNIHSAKVRYINDGWSIYFNQLRSLRPERMSNKKVGSIRLPFDKDGFNFNKAFLEKEIFVEQFLNGKETSLLYNKFPFANFHGLLVVERKKQYQQYLTEEMFHYIWSVYLLFKENIKNQLIAYNSLGAGASVNHLHFQSCILDKPLSLVSSKWSHNGGSDDYPAECIRLDSVIDAWHCIDNLQEHSIPYNLVIINACIYCLPRKLNNNKSELIPQIGWFEMAGGFSLADDNVFSILENEQVREVLSDASLRVSMID